MLVVAIAKFYLDN